MKHMKKLVTLLAACAGAHHGAGTGGSRFGVHCG